MKALVLSGGGARGAYQVGVIKAIAEIARSLQIKAPFQIYTGVSAGAINASCMAWGADQFSNQALYLEKLWSNLTADQVFRTDMLSLGKIGFKWMGELSFGALTGATAGRSLLDTSPLRSLIDNNMNYERLDDLIHTGELKALVLTALDFKSSNSISFVHGDPQLPDWTRSRRFSRKEKIRGEHIMASSAIPLLFPPVEVGHSYFGDGCVRNIAPMSPAIRLGAKQIFVIGVRKAGWTSDDDRQKKSLSAPSVARVLNVLMNSVLLDGIEADVERLDEMNRFVEKVPPESREQLNFRTIPVEWVYPSEDIGHHANLMSSRLPRLIRYLLKGLGPLDDASELISYLLFDPEFCQKLIHFGYTDGLAKRESIEKFLKA